MTELIPHYFNIKYFFQFMRSSELVLFWIHLFNCLVSTYVYERNKSFFLVISIIFNSYINQYLKNYICKPIFNLVGDYIPLLGQGTRPEGATDCGYFGTCPNIKSSSFGFPSGHSQFAGLYSGFMIRDILSESPNYSFIQLPNTKKVNVVLYLLYIIMMMFSRVYIQGCHTVGQTVFGALIGLYLGFLFNKLFKNDFIKFDNKFKTITNNLDNYKSKISLIIIIIIFSTFAR